MRRQIVSRARGVGANVVRGVDVSAQAASQTTAFTYQGQLIAGGTLPTGLYQFTFTLYDAASGGSQVVGTPRFSIRSSDQRVVHHGPRFRAGISGTQTWLEVKVGTTTLNEETLAARQPIDAVPVAQYALNYPPENSAISLRSCLPTMPLPSLSAQRFRFRRRTQFGHRCDNTSIGQPISIEFDRHIPSDVSSQRERSRPIGSGARRRGSSLYGRWSCDRHEPDRRHVFGVDDRGEFPAERPQSRKRHRRTDNHTICGRNTTRIRSSGNYTTALKARSCSRVFVAARSQSVGPTA